MQTRVWAAVLVGSGLATATVWAEEVGIDPLEPDELGIVIDEPVGDEEQVLWIEPWLEDGGVPEDEWIYWMMPIDEGFIDSEPLPDGGPEILPDEVLIDPIDGWVVDEEFGWPTDEIPPYVRNDGDEIFQTTSENAGGGAATAPTPTAALAGAALLGLAAMRSRRARN